MSSFNLIQAVRCASIRRWHRLALVGLWLGTLAVAACENGVQAPPVSEDIPADIPARVEPPFTIPSPATFVDGVSAPFGTFNGISYKRHTGFFEGVTSLGAFRMPYEIVAPSEPGSSNGTVLVEPPHFGLGTVGRDAVLGHDLLFGNGFSYVTVGYSDNLLTVLDPTASGLVLRGAPVTNPGGPSTAPVDEEILIQFTKALTQEPFAVEILGPMDRVYAYGISQTAVALLELQRNPAAMQGASLFDLTLLHVAVLRSPVQPPGVVQFLDGDFEPIGGVGRVLFVESEGDLVVSDAEEFRRAVGVPDYRVYELAGAAHLPTATNPLDHLAVARALFVAGDAWVRYGVEPPPSTLMQASSPGQIDPVYGVETGIARDADLNALGGVRLPDLGVGRAQFIASDPATPPPGPFAILTGNMVDLACEPRPNAPDDEPRFRNHGKYVSAIAEEVNELEREGFLLGADARAVKSQAANSEVGKPGTCDS